MNCCKKNNPFQKVKKKKFEKNNRFTRLRICVNERRATNMIPHLTGHEHEHNALQKQLHD
jgi:hypothetical protein